MNFVQKSRPNSNKPLRNTFINLILLIWLVIFLAVLFSHRESKKELATSILDASRESLLVGDNRSAMIIVGKGIPKWFSSASFTKSNRIQIFKIEDSYTFLNLSINLPIWLIPGQKEFGFAHFTYSIAEILFPLSIWMLLSGIITLLLYYREKFKLLKELELKSKVAFLAAEQAIAKQISHDIRSPLSAINMAITVPDLNRDDVKEVLKNATLRINEITSELLSKSNQVSSAEQKGMILSKFNIISLVSRAVEEKKFEFLKREDIHISIENDTEEALIQANDADLKRIISNLLNNAIEAQATGRKLNISVTIITNDNSNKITIKIADNGIGIPKKTLRSLGKKKVSFGKNQSNAGYGLGVYDAFEKIHSMNGQIFFESQENIGTTVNICFPRAL